jgi:hypothetical protein
MFLCDIWRCASNSWWVFEAFGMFGVWNDFYRSERGRVLRCDSIFGCLHKYRGKAAGLWVKGIEILHILNCKKGKSSLGLTAEFLKLKYWYQSQKTWNSFKQQSFLSYRFCYFYVWSHRKGRKISPLRTVIVDGSRLLTLQQVVSMQLWSSAWILEHFFPQP